MKIWIMLVLQLLLLGLCEAHRAPPPPGSASKRETGEVPVSQLRMLSLGLGHLLHGVEENVERLEKQGEVVAAELNGATKTVDSLRKQSIQTGRTNRQVRKDLQMLSARRDRLWRAVRGLQKELEAEQGAMQQRMNRVVQKVKILTEPRSGGQTDIRCMKALLDKQARRLALLTSEVSSRERVIDRRLQHIEHLEKRLASGV